MHRHPERSPPLPGGNARIAIRRTHPLFATWMCSIKTIDFADLTQKSHNRSRSMEAAFQNVAWQSILLQLSAAYPGPRARASASQDSLPPSPRGVSPLVSACSPKMTRTGLTSHQDVTSQAPAKTTYVTRYSRLSSSDALIGCTNFS